MTADSAQNSATNKRRGKRAEPAETQPPFEAQLEELDEIVLALEDGRLPLEEALTIYEHGMRMAKACQDRLDEAELRVRRLRVTAPDSEAQQEVFSLEDFESEE